MILSPYGFIRPRTLIYFCVITLILLLLVLYSVALNSYTEEKERMRNADSLDRFYNTTKVCGLFKNSTDEILRRTFLTLNDSRNEDYKVLHCGDCGHCSTLYDFLIHRRTSSSLTNMVRKCAAKIFISKQFVFRCMERNVGFTYECGKCWTDNIQCTFSKCKVTCILDKLFGKHNNDPNTKELSPCLECDEKICGPDFLTCAGMNRRRAGIVSDIDRDNSHICKVVDEKEILRLIKF
jgi:hypothetical protein